MRVIDNINKKYLFKVTVILNRMKYFSFSLLVKQKREVILTFKF